MRNLVFGLLLSLGLLSCSNHEETIKHLSELDSLQNEHSRLEKMFAEINPAEVITIVSTIEADMDSALKLCQQSKARLTPEDGTFFGRYQALKTGVKKFEPRYEKIKAELALSETQLMNLKAAQGNKKLDIEALKKYTITEKLALENLTEAVEQLHSSAVYVTANYSEYRPLFLEKLNEFSKRKK